MTTILDVTTAKAVIRYETTRNAEVYSDYIAANDVTVDTIGAHALAVAMLKYPEAKPSSRADQGTDDYRAHVLRSAVRNGLKRNMGVGPVKAEKNEALTVTWIDADGKTHQRKIDPSADLFAELTETLFADED